MDKIATKEALSQVANALNDKIDNLFVEFEENVDENNPTEISDNTFYQKLLYAGFIKINNEVLTKCYIPASTFSSIANISVVDNFWGSCKFSAADDSVYAYEGWVLYTANSVHYIKYVEL